ncbi:MAG: hypothetical protein WDN26_15405 [Chitinophagaceae bacterium]
MNRISFCFLVLAGVFSTFCSAQFSKGTKMVGANIGNVFFNSGTSDYTVPAPTNGYSVTNNSLGVNFSPNIGWFISDKIVAGGQLSPGYKYEKKLQADANNVTYYKNETKSFNLSIGVFARNYFSTNGNFIPFVQVNVAGGFGSSNHEGFYYNNSPLYKDVFSGKSSGDFLMNGGISFGATKMLNDHVGIDFMAGYTYSYNKNKYKTNTARDVGINGSIDERPESDLTTKSTNHNFLLAVGLQVFLDKK